MLVFDGVVPSPMTLRKTKCYKLTAQISKYLQILMIFQTKCHMVALVARVREISDIRPCPQYIFCFSLYRIERESWKRTIFTPTDS